MQPKILGIIIVLLIIIVGGYFLLGGNYPAPVSTVTPEKTKDPTKVPPTTPALPSGITEISVIGTEFSFSPASINVKAGEKVKITFRNDGRALHNLIVEGLNVGTKTIGGGQQETIEFTAPSTGTYAFFCSLPGHRASGMEGSLKVE